MSDIFISYARDDRSKVEPLAKALEDQGWSVWWDPRIRGGQHFDRVIEEALSKTRCVLVVWSQASVDSDWVRAEASFGLNKGFLISIAIESDVVPPVRFLNIHTELLLDWDGKKTSPAFEKIVRDLEAVIGRPESSGKPADKEKEPPDLDAMVEIPAGEFIYQDDKATIEKPYLIDIYPVTNKLYEKFIKACGYQSEQLWSEAGQVWLNGEKATEPKYWHDDKWNQPEHPVVGVNYYEAEGFARWAGKRLPTELEWERAAAGTDGRLYPWGNDFDRERFNTSESSESSIGKTTKVTRYPNGVSPVGCYDMVGNVCEWTANLFDEGKWSRVLRGSSFLSYQSSARCANRNMCVLYTREFHIGFRCARTLK